MEPSAASAVVLIMAMNDEQKAETRTAFADAVNMTPAAFDRWLDTRESKEVGWQADDGDGESVGHKSGKLILAIRRKKVENLTYADYQHMAKVVGYVHRHLAQRPSGNIENSRWRYSLMNWGHDPMKSAEG